MNNSKLPDVMEQHTKRVKKIAAGIRQAAKAQRPIKVDHGGSNSTRLPDFTGRYVVDMQAFSNILEINEKEQYVLVEPSIQLDDLVRATLRYNLVPPVVMEFPGISVGGGVQGGAAESSSFKYGGFHETALEYEVILGDGTVVNASRQEHAELFWGTACSYGSLGILSAVKLRLIPAQPFVRLRYIRTAGYTNALSVLDEAVQSKQTDFIDGILFGKDRGVIMSGTFAPSASGSISRFTGKNDEWFYLHAERVSKQHERYEEYIPLEDYLFRYDRGAFWAGSLAFRYVKLPFTKLTRRLLDSAMHTRRLYEFVHKTDLSQHFFVQDIFMPEDKMAAFLPYVEAHIGVWPLWLLPMKNTHRKEDIFGLGFTGARYAINVGIWGDPRTASFAAFTALNRQVEQQLLTIPARKTLYAHSYYPEDEFWKVYDQKRYIALRQKYHASGVFDDIYAKVTVKEQYHKPLYKAIWHHFIR
jgi:delta24-sterol reductase